MTTDETMNGVKAVLIECLGTTNPILSSDILSEDLGADELDYVEITLELETKFDVLLRDGSEITERTTVKALADRVQRAINRRGAPGTKVKP